MVIHVYYDPSHFPMSVGSQMYTPANNMGTAPTVIPTEPNTQFHPVPGSQSQPAANSNYFLFLFTMVLLLSPLHLAKVSLYWFSGSSRY
jgi:hypothetical protein